MHQEAVSQTPGMEEAERLDLLEQNTAANECGDAANECGLLFQCQTEKGAKGLAEEQGDLIYGLN